MKKLVCLLTLSIAILGKGSPPKYELKEEWNLWKTQHGKHYESEYVELERHLVWLSNKEYIEHHNANADVLGFKLAMNHHGDLVTSKIGKVASRALL